LALPANISLSFKSLPLKNILPYLPGAVLTEKSFIPINHRFLNVLYNDKSQAAVNEKLAEIKSKCPNFKNQRFINGPTGDDPIILKGWNKLVDEAGIGSPQDCYREFSSMKLVKKKTTNIKKCRSLYH
jgi:hypothetical protein